MFNLINKAVLPSNRLIELYFNGVVSGKKILFIGGFHGDEPQGVEILNEYLKLCHAAENSIYVLPCFNPDGLFAVKRVNSNGVDLNRNFPTKNWELTNKDEFFGGETPASEWETRFMCDILGEIKPDLILTIHAPFKVVNYDGDGLLCSQRIAEIMGYPVQSDIGYPTPGSFGTYCGIERGISTITLELGEDEDMKSLKARCFKVFEYLSFLK